jgi:hypothetical protein
LFHQVLTESPSVFKKKSHGAGPWPSYFQRARAGLVACPGFLFSSSRALTEEGRPIGKAKKANIKETHLLSSTHHILRITFFERNVNSS